MSHTHENSIVYLLVLILCLYQPLKSDESDCTLDSLEKLLLLKATSGDQSQSVNELIIEQANCLETDGDAKSIRDSILISIAEGDDSNVRLLMTEMVSRFNYLKEKMGELYYLAGIHYRLKITNHSLGLPFIPFTSATKIADSVTLRYYYRQLLINLGQQYYGVMSDSSFINYDIKSFDDWRELGFMFIAENELQDALDCFDSALLYNDKDVLIWHILGSIYTLMSEYPSSVECYINAIELDHTYFPAWFGIAMNSKLFHEYNLSLMAADSAIYYAPDDSEYKSKCWLTRANTLFLGSKNYQQALDNLDSAFYYWPENADAWFDLARISVAMGKDEKALKSFDSCLYYQPDFGFAWKEKGKLQIKLGEYNDAILSCDSALKYFRDLDFKNGLMEQLSWFYRGVALKEKGEYRMAANNFSRALDFDPSDMTSRANRAMCYFAIEQFDSSSYDLEIITKEDRENPAVWLMCGYSYQRIDKNQLAIDCYDSMLTKMHDVLSTISGNCMEFHFEIFLRDHPATSLTLAELNYWNSRATSLEKLNRFNEALKCCDSSLKYSPNNPDALQIKSRISGKK